MAGDFVPLIEPLPAIGIIASTIISNYQTEVLLSRSNSTRSNRLNLLYLCLAP